MRRTWFAVGSALVLIGVLLGLPAPRHPVPVAATASPSKPTLASVWPRAKPFSIPAIFPDGSTYTPTLILDPSLSMGTVASADGQRVDLDLVPADGPPRVLQSQLIADGGSFDGLGYAGGQVYWMHTLSDANGSAHVTLWTAPRSGGPARQLTADIGAPTFYGSQYDVQPVGDRLYWVAGGPGRQDRTELRSIALGGGTVSVKVLDGAWAMSRWPWLVTAPSASDQPTRLLDVSTGRIVSVRAPANKQVTCSPSWCRLIPNNSAQATETDLVRPDGTGTMVIGGANDAAVASDVALRDRFEVVMSIANANGQIAISTLALFDIARRHSVLVSPVATNAGGRGDYLWWSTGDNETLAWHGLDLRTLT
jgi:hypothetical protein